MKQFGSLGDRIRVARTGKYTQEELAELVGIHVVTLRRWEKGDNPPHSEALARLARALGISADYLLGQSDVMLPERREREYETPFADAADTEAIADIVQENRYHTVSVRVLPKDVRACRGREPFWRGKDYRFEAVMRLPVPDVVQFSPLVGIYAEDDSMWPSIQSGELVIFSDNMNRFRGVVTGDVVIAAYNGRMIIRGLLLRGGRVTLRAENPNSRDIDLADDDEFDVLGKVLKVYSVRDISPVY